MKCEVEVTDEFKLIITGGPAAPRGSGRSPWPIVTMSHMRHGPIGEPSLFVRQDRHTDRGRQHQPAPAHSPTSTAHRSAGSSDTGALRIRLFGVKCFCRSCCLI